MSLNQLKRELLAQRLELLTTQFKAAYQQLNQTLSAADKVAVEQIINQLELEITAVERELTTLGGGGSSVPASGPVSAGPKIDVPVWQQIGIEMVHIPAGEFLYGEDKRTVYLDELWISRTPVTNRQYEAFVNATDYKRPEHWEGRAVHPSRANHPVVYVSWHDAQAFCEWAGVHLPTEQQWEKAARGADGRAYPWGNEPPTDRLCNFNRNVDDTTPVGRYSPQGDSPYGLIDMAGNVWEWCEDWYDSDRATRVLRGGAWYYGADRVRCAYRSYVRPLGRNPSVGFRVVSPGF